MVLHVVAGAGPIGATTALLLADAGHRVRVLTRSGSGPEHHLVERVRLDVTDADALAKAAAGAAALYNCVNPEYSEWPMAWPPITSAMISAAERTQAVLVLTGNLYAYGPVSRPMVESMSLAATEPKGRSRARMWEETLAAHHAGRIRATELRASDFYGPRVLESSLAERVFPRLLKGKKAQVLGPTSVPHAYTFAPDVARALVTAAGDPRAWGRAWHVPTLPAITTAKMVGAAAAASGVDNPGVSAIPMWALRPLGLFSSTMREIRRISYQFDQPWVVDSSAFETTFGQRPTPLREAMAQTVEWWRTRISPASSATAAGAA